jgi:hypothetical protein
MQMQFSRLCQNKNKHCVNSLRIEQPENPGTGRNIPNMPNSWEETVMMMLTILKQVKSVPHREGLELKCRLQNTRGKHSIQEPEMNATKQV